MTVNSKVGKYLEVDSSATPTLEIHKEGESIHILHIILFSQYLCFYSFVAIYFFQ